MRRRTLTVWLVCVVLFGIAGSAQGTFEADGTGTGSAVLWFAGTKVTAELAGDVSFAGSMILDGEAVAFQVTGTAEAAGVGDSAALALDAWIAVSAEGTTDDGTPIALRGGISISSADADLSGTAVGSAEGLFFFTITYADAEYEASGVAEGTATGAFVVPDDPMTMQVEGTALFSLSGDVSPLHVADEGAGLDLEAKLPWEAGSWPGDILAELYRILGIPVEDEES